MTGNQERLEQLWRLQLPSVLNYARRRVDSLEDAQEIAAEVFLTAWRLIETVPDGNEARPWLFTVARHVILNTDRTAVRRSRLTERVASELHIDAVAGEPFGTTETATKVREALSRLRERDRELLVLISWDGLTHAEAGQVLKINPAALRVRLHRARQRLRMHLRCLGLETDSAEEAGSNAESAYVATSEMI